MSDAVPTVVKTGDLVIDLDHRKVYVKGEPLLLFPKEYRLLEYLAFNKGKTVSDAALRAYIHVTGQNDRKTIRTRIRKLRRKIAVAAHDTSRVTYIEATQDNGFRLHWFLFDDSK